MVYLVWGLVGMGVVVGIALGATLGIRMDLGKMSDGTMLVGYTGEEDDGAHLFLNLAGILKIFRFCAVQYAALRAGQAVKENKNDQEERTRCSRPPKTWIKSAQMKNCLSAR